jgi:hypothetical protein
VSSHVGAERTYNKRPSPPQLLYKYLYAGQCERVAAKDRHDDDCDEYEYHDEVEEKREKHGDTNYAKDPGAHTSAPAATTSNSNDEKKEDDDVEEGGGGGGAARVPVEIGLRLDG